jgi:hypothetical protein
MEKGRDFLTRPMLWARVKARRNTRCACHDCEGSLVQHLTWRGLLAVGMGQRNLGLVARNRVGRGPDYTRNQLTADLVQEDGNDQDRGNNAKVADHLAHDSMGIKANDKSRHSDFSVSAIRKYNTAIFFCLSPYLING